MNRSTPSVPEHSPSPPVPTRAGAISDTQVLTTECLAGNWLSITRAAWMVAAILALGVLVASIPGYGLVVSQGHFAGRVVEAPARLVHVLDLAGALASFVSALVCLSLAGLLVWRKPSDRMALFVAFYLLVFGIVLAGPLERLEPLVPGAGILTTDVLQPVVAVVPNVALLALFPNGRFVPDWARWLVLLSVVQFSLVWAPLAQYAPALWWTDPANWLTWTFYAVAGLTLGIAVSTQVYRFRHVSSPVERQQTKWVASGVVCWALLASGASVVTFLPRSGTFSAAVPWWIPVGSLLWWLSLDVIPLALTVAVLRFRLFDIDFVIRRTLLYGTLTVILGAVYFAVVLGAQTVVRAVTGQTGQQAGFIVASTLLVAALFRPVRHQVQAVIDRRFYRRKYDAEQTLAAFGQTLRGEVNLEQLGERLLVVVEETMQPVHASFWLRSLTDLGVTH